MAAERGHAGHSATGSRERVERAARIAASVSPPYWRGDRYFLMRREPAPAVLRPVVGRPRTATERVLIDPMALDPSGLTTLDTWQPTKEGDLLAYQLSEGGTEESLAVRHGRRHRRARRRARSTARATPPSPGCPAARRTTTSAGSTRRSCPRPSATSTAACTCTASARRPDDRRRDLRRRAWR